MCGVIATGSCQVTDDCSCIVSHVGYGGTTEYPDNAVCRVQNLPAAPLTVERWDIEDCCDKMKIVTSTSQGGGATEVQTVFRNKPNLLASVLVPCILNLFFALIFLHAGPLDSDN